MSETERTVINSRGYCLFCLGKVRRDNNNDALESPFSTPTSSPLSTPLRSRYRNIHSLPLEERIAPFTDLCRFLGVDIPDCYAFGDGVEPEMLTPPLCEKCNALSARLCLLQDELQYLQLRMSNTVKRIYQRVTSTCDQRKGALKRESFQKEFRRKSKGSLSRGRSESSEVKKVTNLVKAFQMKVMEKDHENAENRKRRDTTFISSQGRNPDLTLDMPIEIEVVDADIVQDESENGDESEFKENEEKDEAIDEEEEEERYLPLEETLRSIIVVDDDIFNKDHEFELVGGVDHVASKVTKPESEQSTLLCTSFEDDGKKTGNEENIDEAVVVEKNQGKEINKNNFHFNCEQSTTSRIMTRAVLRRRLEFECGAANERNESGMVLASKRRRK